MKSGSSQLFNRAKSEKFTKKTRFLLVGVAGFLFLLTSGIITASILTQNKKIEESVGYVDPEEIATERNEIVNNIIRLTDVPTVESNQEAVDFIDGQIAKLGIPEEGSDNFHFMIELLLYRNSAWENIGNKDAEIIDTLSQIKDEWLDDDKKFFVLAQYLRTYIRLGDEDNADIYRKKLNEAQALSGLGV